MNQKLLIETVERARREYVFSAYQLFLFSPQRELKFSGGVTSYWPDGQAVSDQTFFDVGSLTKVILTTSILATAVERQELHLEAQVGDYLAGVSPTLKSITLLQLASHCSGLKAWVPLYDQLKRPDLKAAWRSPGEGWLENPPATKAVYSDLGMLLLGSILEEKLGNLEELFQERVLKPMGIQGIKYGPLLKENTVATEYSLHRFKLCHGSVFDHNCEFLGGKTAHAGLFATSSSVGAWALEWLRASQGKSKWLGRETANRFITPTRLVPGSTWAVGWDTPSVLYSSAGNRFSRKSFGHLGFPGCSVWTDPEAQLIGVLLTNRIHPSRYDDRLKGLRPKIYDAIYASLVE